MRYTTVIFDFDGTLADSRDVGMEVMNGLADEFGYAPIRADEISALQAISARELVRKRAGIPLWNIFKLRRFEGRAREELERRSTSIQLFEGIAEMLKELRGARCELGVVTSNDEKIVYQALGRAGTDVDFVQAGSSFFGKARAIRNALKTYHIDRSHAVYVGDELRDIEACKKVGIDMTAVGWGFNDAETLQGAGVRVAATPQELFVMLAK